MKFFNNNYCKQGLLFICLTIFLAIVFNANLYGFVNDKFFWEEETSDSLVLGRIMADASGLDKKDANLGFAFKDTPGYPESVHESYVIFSTGKAIGDAKGFVSYTSQYGIQGTFFSKIHRVFGINTLLGLQRINGTLLAIVIVWLFFLYREIYDIRFAVIFIITMVSSPWIVQFARQLYWMSFLWFVPALLAAILYTRQGKKDRILLLLGIAISVFIKSLCGYEYLSSITLLACSVFAVAPFFEEKGERSSLNLKLLFLVFGACVIGFVGALLMHAGMRGDSILSGLRNIYEQDVKRRTYGDPSLFDALYTASLQASPLSVVMTYVTDWKTPLVLWLPGEMFKYLIGISLAGLCYKFFNEHPSRMRDAVLLVVFFVVPISWFVLAKGHSHIHTGLNFVLWYFGFIQALIYVTLNTALILSIRFIDWIRTAQISKL